MHVTAIFILNPRCIRLNNYVTGDYYVYVGCYPNIPGVKINIVVVFPRVSFTLRERPEMISG